MEQLYSLSINPQIQAPEAPPEAKIIDAEVLIQKTFEVDEKAGMELLFRRYYSVLCSHAIRYVSSRAVAEDIVSDIFFEFQSKGLYRVVSTSYRAYLFTSVRNRAYDLVRKETHQMTAGMESAMAVSTQNCDQPDSITQFEELHHLIEDTINAMPLKRKQVYMMHRFEGKKCNEIAESLQVSPRTVEAHIYKAIRQVHAMLHNHWL